MVGDGMVQTGDVVCYNCYKKLNSLNSEEFLESEDESFLSDDQMSDDTDESMYAEVEVTTIAAPALLQNVLPLLGESPVKSSKLLLYFS